MKTHRPDSRSIDSKHLTKTIELLIEGMTCNGCESTIKKAVEKVEGVKAANADYVVGKAVITYDPRISDERDIHSAIKEAGYAVIPKKRKGNDRDDGEYFEISEKAIYVSFALGIILVIAGAYYLIDSFGISLDFPEISKNTSYLILFGLGILTGFHCIAMCGGFVLSYSVKQGSNAFSHVKYGVSKTISYTIIGAIFGAIGSAIAFTPKIRGIAAILAGIFLLIFGLNMLGFLPSLRNLRIPQPRFVSRIKAGKSPIAIGLLNGLFIACGPLQAMYIFAAGTGDILQGALSLMFFGLGTLPVLLGFGMAASYFTRTATHKILRFSGVLVIVLGLIMMNRGLALSGSGFDAKTIQTIIESNNNLEAAGYVPKVDASTQVAKLGGGYQTIRMDVTYAGWSPDKFVLKKGVPARWIINGKELTSCNNAIVVPKYDLQFRINQGEQTIEFTPKESGIVPWSCWMGMIPGTFIVKDDLPSSADSAGIAAVQQEVQQEADLIPRQKSGSCGGAGSGSSGGCGCAGLR